MKLIKWIAQHHCTRIKETVMTIATPPTDVTSSPPEPENMLFYMARRPSQMRLSKESGGGGFLLDCPRRPNAIITALRRERQGDRGHRDKT
jgi:hypothetical protein